MRPSRDTWLVLGLLLALSLVTALLSIRRSSQGELPGYYSQSSQPNGALALRLWLEAQKFTVLADQLETPSFAPPRQARLLFVLEPSVFSDDELEKLDEWVKSGNTLIAAGNDSGSLALARHYKFQPTLHAEALTGISQAAPLLILPPLTVGPILQTDTSFNTNRADFVTYLAAAGSSLMVSFTVGNGQVILLSAARPFSNEGLKDAGSPELILNILAISHTHGPVWFDEWHHGIRGTQTQNIGPENWLQHTPTGHALLFVIMVIFLGLLLQGHIFGRPVPISREIRRRAPVEYITAIANLSRRANHRANVLAQYRASLKRGLGRRYRLDPTTPDELYVAQLGKYKPQMDQPALLLLLTRLSSPSPSETELLKLAAEVADWLKDIPSIS